VAEHKRYGVVRKTPLFAPFIYENASFCQDRPGTNIGKNQKRVAFFLGVMARATAARPAGRGRRSVPLIIRPVAVRKTHVLSPLVMKNDYIPDRLGMITRETIC
jgi:hypothetical protein